MDRCAGKKECEVCTRSALCKNYGVVTCDACKMFFRRAVFENLYYMCSKNFKCLEESATFGRICRRCRMLKCFELGMDYTPQSIGALEVKNWKDDQLTSLLKDLDAMDTSWTMKLVYFDTDDDPSLEEVLGGRRAVLKRKTDRLSVSQENLSPFSIYVYVLSMMSFDFVKKLHPSDKVSLFREAVSRTKVLCAIMRKVKDLKENGQEMYSPVLMQALNVDTERMKRVWLSLAFRLLELNVTTEEALLLRLIFFCDSSIPDLSDSARYVLSTHQKTFTSALFQLCQITHQQAAPLRLTDLLSLSHLITKIDQDVKYMAMLFQCFMPSYKFRQLSIDTLQLADKHENLNRNLNL